MKLIFIALNEINFDVVNSYIDRGTPLPGFKALLANHMTSTESESEYNNLEPWIQWPSIHTGKTYKEHNIFRLGDFINSSDKQFFEKVEKAGFSVGAITPMNASNKLKNPAYFIPDPWTQTPSDRGFFSQKISNAIAQAVNDNAESKITLRTFFDLVLAFIFLVKPSRYIPLMTYALLALNKPWRRALFLDMFLHEIHMTLFKRKKPNFSTLFLNAGAHIQHRYFFNSSYVNSPRLQNPRWYIDNNVDPVLEMLKVYDNLLRDLLGLANTEIIVATGLSQKPYEQLKCYYRLRNHKDFLNMVGIKFRNVLPRMTRDFLIEFDNSEEAKLAESQLSQILVDNEIKLFGEIDNRGKDIFVVLTYPLEIIEKTAIHISGGELLLKDHLSFIAIKNGEHQSKGYSFFSKGVSKFAPPNGSHVSKIHNAVLQFFGINIKK
jgi:hypothetical protein